MIETKEECVLECFKPGMTVWNVENFATAQPC